MIDELELKQQIELLERELSEIRQRESNVLHTLNFIRNLKGGKDNTPNLKSNKSRSITPKSLSEIVLEVLLDNEIKSSKQIIEDAIKLYPDRNGESIRTTIKKLANSNEIKKVGYGKYQRN